jgi:hypothetical protein
MKKIFLIILLFSFASFKLISQDKDYSLARVGVKVENIYIFIGCTPVQEYNTIDTWEVYWNKDGKLEEKIEEAVTRARKKYNNVDGIIFKAGANSGEFIKFIGKEITGGGFKGGDKIQYRDGRILNYGEISLLDNTKQRATIKYLNEYGDEKTETIPYEKLTPINKEEYHKVIEKQNAEIQKHKFTNGEKVTWADGNKPYYGEILSLNNEKHDAKINYLDKFGDTKTETVNFLKIEKADESKYKEFITAQDIEIQKHKYIIGETVSFIDDKAIKVAEVTALNGSNHKATVKYLNIFGEEKITDKPYFDLEKISKDKFQHETEMYQKEIAKYKFKAGEKVSWSKANLLKKIDVIQCEIISLDDLSHKALVKYIDKENKEVQTKADYLDLTKVN